MKRVVTIVAVALTMTACGPDKPTRWQAPGEQSYPVCWADLSNKPCVEKRDGNTHVLHIPPVVTGVEIEVPVEVVYTEENGNLRVVLLP